MLKFTDEELKLILEAILCRTVLASDTYLGDISDKIKKKYEMFLKIQNKIKKELKINV